MTTTGQTIKEEVRNRYGKAATRARENAADGGCCGGEGDGNAISSHLYTTDEIRELPQEAVVASLGCGNPVAIADLREGETVLDLGSGGGIDVLASPRRIRALVAGRALRWLTGPAIPARRAIYSVTARPALRLADTVLGGPLLEDVAEFLIDLRVTYDGIGKRSRRVEARFSSAAIVLVTTADPAPMRETARFFAELPEWSSPPRAVVFNRSLPDEWWAFERRSGDALDANLERWGAEARRQAEARAEVSARYGLVPVVVPWIPEAPADPQGLAELARATGKLDLLSLGF